MIPAFLIILNFAMTLRILFPTPENTLRQFAYDWSDGFFQDMHQRITASSGHPDGYRAFHRFYQKFVYDGQIEEISVEIKRQPWVRRAPLNAEAIITYKTRYLGSFTHAAALPLVRDGGLWKIVWKPEYFLPGLTSDSRLETAVDFARRGSIVGSDRKPIVQDVQGKMVWVTPKEIEQQAENQFLNQIVRLSGEKLTAVAVHHKYTANRQPDWQVPILPVLLTETQIGSFSRFRGVALTDHLVRAYYPYTLKPIGSVTNSLYAECCSFLYSTTNYDGDSGMEKDNNGVLKGRNGGSLKIIGPSGKTIRTLIETERKDGSDAEA